MAEQKPDSLCVVIPYFGKFPNYFPIWLESCASNPKVNWLLFTDVETFYDYPSNVKVVPFTLEKVRQMAIEVLQRDFEISGDIHLAKPHKLCDYRPIYGKIFGEWLQEYAFWGYGDIDLVYGDICKQITPQVLAGYDKILGWGHLSFIKNTSQVTDAIVEFVKQEKVKQGMLFSDRNYVFDEWHGAENINNWLVGKGFKIYEGANFMDVSAIHRRMRRNLWNKETRTFGLDTKDNLVVWHQGILLRYFIGESGVKKLESQEIVYVHLKERPMILEINMGDFVNHVDRKPLAIYPNKFLWAKFEKDKIQVELYKIYRDSIEPLIHFLKRRYKRRKQNLKFKLRVALGKVK